MACFEHFGTSNCSKKAPALDFSFFWWSPLFSNCRVSDEIYRCPQICVFFFFFFHSCFYFLFWGLATRDPCSRRFVLLPRTDVQKKFWWTRSKTNGTPAKPQSTSASVTYWSAVITETLCCPCESMSCWLIDDGDWRLCRFQVNMSSWPCTSTSRGKWASSWFRRTSPVSWRWFWPRSPSGLIRNLFQLGLCSVSEPSHESFFFFFFLLVF